MSHYIGLYSGDANSRGQTGGSLTDIQIYRGPRTLQGGAGLGKYFASAFQYLRPLINSGVNALTDQGVKSATSVLSQLGKKDLKTILTEERQKAFDNLSTKAINKLQRINTQSLAANQAETGTEIMPFGLSPIQLQRINRRKGGKSIKTATFGRKGHSRRKRKGTTTKSTLSRTKRGQIGHGRKRKTQVGGRRTKRRKTKKSKKAKLRQLDIFA